MTEDTPIPPEPVATGDRRGEAHVAPDRDQKFRAEFLRHPDSRPPPQEQSAAEERDEISPDAPPVEDVRLAPDGPSVWDARPRKDAEGSEPSGTPKGH